ncbi:MAG: TonB-dependent receptor [Steroidobacteraceae bacterium]|nr:TonB-dependent receptor [Steroidobacteraceae bacterium]
MPRPRARIRRLIICGLGLLPAAAGAQESTVALEEIVVTGTRIARADAASPSPTLVVESTAFAERAAFTVESTLNAFPQFTPAAGSASVSPDSDGLATLSLRGLGPTRTLVLVNGRRLIPGDGLGQVDLNVLPPQLIETVEVVTGGASAVYGSDAVAGVVNFRLREDFTGVHLAGQWSQTDHGDGQEYNAGLTAGTDVADGAGSIVAYLGYSERDQVMQDARAFSRAPLSYYPDETTGVGPQGRFLAMGDAVTDDGFGVVFAEPAVFDHLFESYGYPAGSVPYQPLMRLNDDGTVFTGGLTAVGTEVPGGVANYRGEPDPVLSYRRAYTYDFAPHTALQLPLERITGFVAGRYQLSDATELFGQLHYADYTASRRLAPAVTSIALVPVTNPHITPDLRLLLDARANPAAPFRLQKRTTAVGPRIADNDRQLLQATVGVNGRVHDWSYEVYAQFGRNERTEQQSGNVRLSRVEELTFAADGGLAICGGFDPFSKAPISAACADHIAVVASNEVTVEQWLGEASISGELFDLPAGPARIAAGLFHKHDEFDYRADPVLTESLPGVPGVIGPRPDVVGFPAGADRAGSESNTDVYVEAVLPLLRWRPGAAALELGLGYRRAEYDQAGGVDAWKADLVFRPVESAALRGSYQRAVRAPSIEELFYPEINDEFFIRPPDPCDPNSPERQGPDQSQVEALCVAQGMSPELLATYENPLARVKGVTGGNPELEPEQADTYTLGLVLTSPFSHAALATLQLSLDWYWIEVDDAVGRWDAESAVGRCFDPNYNPTYDPGNVFCTFFERIPETGEIFARVIDRNLGSLETAGLDLQLAWAVEAGPGRLTTEAYFTHVSRWRLRDPGGTTLDYAGTIGGQVLGHAFPEWKGQLRLGYGWGPAELYARWRYVDHLRDVEYPAFVVPHRDYLDVGATHSFDTGLLKGLVLRAGIDNLLDEEPPVYPSYQQANTEPSLYDVLGRRYYLAATWQF